MKKLILMGLAQTGKTTIINVTAEGMIPQKNVEYSATIDYKRKSYTLFGTKISVFDLGGQKAFLNRFIGELAEFIFTNVESYVYVIDVVDIDKISLARYYFEMGKKMLKKYSPDAKSIILLHKMDLIDKSNKDGFIANIKKFIEYDENDLILETSIYDRSIFNAMKSIITDSKSDSEPIEKIIDKFSSDLSEFVNFIGIYDVSGEIITEPNIEYELKVKDLIEIEKKYATFFNEDLKFTVNQFNTKLVFSSNFENNQKILIIFSTEDLNILYKNYQLLIDHSLKLITELNAFFML